MNFKKIIKRYADLEMAPLEGSMVIEEPSVQEPSLPDN